MSNEEATVGLGLDYVKSCPWCGAKPLRDVYPNICKIKFKIFCPNCKIGFESVIDEPISFGTIIFAMKELNDKWNERV